MDRDFSNFQRSSDHTGYGDESWRSHPTESGADHHPDGSWSGSWPGRREGWPHEPVTNPDPTHGNNDDPGSQGTDPSCPPHCDLPHFFGTLVQHWIEHWHQPDSSNPTPSVHDRLEAALERLVQALASEFPDCTAFDPGPASSIARDQAPTAVIAAAMHQ